MGAVDVSAITVGASQSFAYIAPSGGCVGHLRMIRGGIGLPGWNHSRFRAQRPKALDVLCRWADDEGLRALVGVFWICQLGGFENET
jgi:hypothetical protein